MISQRVHAILGLLIAAASSTVLAEEMYTIYHAGGKSAFHDPCSHADEIDSACAGSARQNAPEIKFGNCITDGGIKAFRIDGAKSKVCTYISADGDCTGITRAIPADVPGGV
jgi:hypothetical protein